MLVDGVSTNGLSALWALNLSTISVDKSVDILVRRLSWQGGW